MPRTPFFERFRQEIARYAPGVHRLGSPPSAEAVKALPEELASFLRSFDGAELFIDALTIFDRAHVEREGDLLVFGETGTGDRMALDLSAPGGPNVVRLEEDTGETLVEGTSFGRWIEGFVVAEGVIYDREGEFREGVFDETGEELAPDAVIKRERKALKLDPSAPAPAWRLARALEKKGQVEEAIRLLEQVTERSPRFSWALFDLARLLETKGELAQAESRFLAAAEADPDASHAGTFAAHAARVAAMRGDEAARARHAARALELAPDVARRQKDACRALLAEGAMEEARSTLEVAAALTPRDLEIIDLRTKLRSST
ncbi:MAG: tetratricopeptide repeat protein [Deltaproteobacteria bacterium]|nr:tetratricopeptide repeat protein [Deltaproteobacteria bacterium]